MTKTMAFLVLLLIGSSIVWRVALWFVFHA